MYDSRKNSNQLTESREASIGSLLRCIFVKYSEVGRNLVLCGVLFIRKGEHFVLLQGIMAFLATEDRFGPDLNRYRQGEPVSLQLFFHGGTIKL